MADLAPAGGALYKLSTECMPCHDSGVQALTALGDDLLVSGANDGTLAVWARLPDGRAFSSAHVSIGEHTGMLRALVPVPPCALAPHGGFASGCLDKVVRVYAWDAVARTAALAASLAGHAGGVDSLSVRTPPGGAPPQLLSAARDGTVRVWSLADGKCAALLEGHENSTRVLALADGRIATGSAGRRNDAGAHVDFRVRLWAADAAGRWAIVKALDDHDQALQDLDGLGPSIFLSASNDGTVKARGEDGEPFETITMPPGADARPVAVFRARALPNGHIAAACEDNAVRLYDPEATAAPEDTIPLPGTPWAVRGLANGDIAVGCTQAGSGARGHVYVFTRDPARFASQDEVARYTRDCVPPKKPSEGGGGGGGGGGGSGANGAIKISGAYEERAAHRGASDGAYGFFRKGGAVMVCAWSAAAGTWEDVGEMQDSEADAVMEADGSGGGGGGAWDYTHTVTLDAPSGGSRSLQLCWNEGDDIMNVAKAFIDKHSLGDDSYEEVRNFCIQVQADSGNAVRARKAAAGKAAIGGSFAHLPTKAFVENAAVDWKKVRGAVPADARARGPTLTPPFPPSPTRAPPPRCGRSSSS